MAEAIGLAASVVALIGLTKVVITRCKLYIHHVKKAPSDLHAILLETSSLKATLKTVEFLDQNGRGTSEALTILFGEDGLVNECTRSLTDLEKLLPTEVVGDKKRDRSGKKATGLSLASLQWPFKQEKAREILKDLSRYKQEISLALTAESMQDIKYLRETTDTIQSLLTDNQRHKIHRWLCHTDPSSLHYKARKDYEPETGTWMLQLPEWKDWLGLQTRFLLLHGIPGAGKTVLMSHLIEQTRLYCREQIAGRGCCIYYYCYHNRNQNESLPLLRWILCQLCEQSTMIPHLVQEMFKYNREPSGEQLLSIIADMVRTFDTTFICVDALDESQAWPELIAILKALNDNSTFHNVQIFVSSREYEEILGPLKELTTAVSMDDPALKDDIQRYVHSTLSKSVVFQQWPQDLLIEVEHALATGAKGMFRWAVCQIDLLQRLKKDRLIIENQLKSLPRTLFETYDRIMSLITPEDQNLVYHILHWIQYHGELYIGSAMPQTILIQAAEKSLTKELKGPLTRHLDSNTLSQICGCLVRVAPLDNDYLYSNLGYVESGVSLAHYTVREYLNSKHLLASSTVALGPSKAAFRHGMMNLVFEEALQVNSNELWSDVSDTQDACILMNEDLNTYCVSTAILTLRNGSEGFLESASLVALAFSLLDPQQPHYDTMVRTMSLISKTVGVFQELFVSWGTQFFWKCKINTTDIRIVHLFNLLLMVDKLGSNPIGELIDDMVRCYPRDVLFRSQIEWELKIGHPSSDGYCKFEGDIVELFTQYWSDDSILTTLLRLGEGCFDPTRVLLLYIGHDRHHLSCERNEEQCHESCSLPKIMELSPNLDPLGYIVFPLQIAVATRDVIGVSTLLAAGADPNGAGDIYGKWWCEDSLMDRFEHLHGVSPLYICENIPGIHSGDVVWDIDKDQTRIKDLLIQYGARDFCSDGPAEV